MKKLFLIALFLTFVSANFRPYSAQYPQPFTVRPVKANRSFNTSFEATVLDDGCLIVPGEDGRASVSINQLHIDMHGASSALGTCKGTAGLITYPDANGVFTIREAGMTVFEANVEYCYKVDLADPVGGCFKLAQ